MSRVDCNHSLTRQLAEFCPEEIVSMYWNEAESLCRVSDKKNYALAASILGEIKTICRNAQMRNIWDRDFDQFLMKHRKKNRLMEMVSPLKRR